MLILGGWQNMKTIGKMAADINGDWWNHDREEVIIIAHKMIIDKMVVDKMVVDKMVVDKMVANKMVIDKMAVEKISQSVCQ